MNWRTVTLFLGLLALVMLAACNGAATTPEAATPELPTPAAEAGTPQITLLPEGGSFNEDVVVSGTGFPPDARVEIHLSGPTAPESPQPYSTVNADADGAFSTTFVMPGQWADGSAIVETNLVVTARTADGSTSAQAEFAYAPLPTTAGMVWEAPGALDCLSNRILFSNTLGVDATLSPARFYDYINEREGAGCAVFATVPVDAYPGQGTLVAEMGRLLQEQGLIENTAYTADGPNTTMTAFTNPDANLLCLLEATRDAENQVYHVVYNCAMDLGRIIGPELPLGIYTPVAIETCTELQQLVSNMTGVQANLITSAPFTDLGGPGTGEGCEIIVQASGAELGADQVALGGAIADRLQETGWQPSPMRTADGPTGMALGFTRGSEVALLSINWEPTYDAVQECPETFVLACDIPPEERQYSISLQVAESE